MKVRSYLTYKGNCQEAIDLYKMAFKTEVIDLQRFSDITPNPNFVISEDFKSKILQCTIKFGEDFIRMSDCGPGGELNDPESDRLSLAIEASVEDVKHAYAILAQEGRAAIPLAETFYSPCAGVVYDKFGVMWNFIGQK